MLSYDHNEGTRHQVVSDVRIDVKQLKFLTESQELPASSVARKWRRKWKVRQSKRLGQSKEARAT